MGNAIHKRSLTKTVIGVTVLMLCGGGLGVYAAMSHYQQRTGELVMRQAVNEARTVADMAENIGTWASRYKGVWIDGKGLSDNQVGNVIDSKRYQLSENLLSDDAVSREDHIATFHRKNPALVQRELADISEQSNSRAKFRLTSDKYMNPSNSPDGFDKRAIRQIEKSGANEYYEVRGGQLRYARKVVAKESCLTCHGSPDKAPKTISMFYPGPQGYGYVVGGVAGVISVTTPYESTPLYEQLPSSL